MRAITTVQDVVSSCEADFTKVAVASGNVVKWAQEEQYVSQVMQKNDDLQKLLNSQSGVNSIRNAIINVANVGLTLQPAAKLAYLVVRGGLAVLDISFRGFVKIAVDSGSILAAKAEVVRRNDQFTYNGPYDAPAHVFNPFATDAERGEIVGVYVLAKLAAGGVMVETMNKEAIDKVKGVSKAQNGPWAKWYEEMAKKTCLKRASKSWPPTERLSTAVAVSDEHEGLTDADLADAPRRRTDAADIAEAAMQVEDSPERQALIARLEDIVTTRGIREYARVWKDELTKDQRKLVGGDEHTRIKSLADVTDVEATAVGGAA